MTPEQAVAKVDLQVVTRRAAMAFILDDPVLSDLCEATHAMATGREGTAWNLLRDLWDRHAPQIWKEQRDDPDSK